MKYSVIIPTFNRLSVISRALESVFSQTLAAEKVVVVDDGSTDNTSEWIELNYPQVVIVKQVNAGVSAARNTGFKNITTDWVALLDSDDEWLPEKMYRQASALSSSGLKVCHSEEIWVRNGVRVNAKKKHQKKQGDIFSDCLKLCAMSPSAIVIHRSIWEEFKGFDESFEVCEDYDLWLRICAEYQVALVGDAMIRKYGGHEDQLSHRYYGMDRYRIMAMQKLLNANLSAWKQDELERVLSHKLFVLYKGSIKHQNHELMNFCEQRRSLFNIDDVPVLESNTANN